MRSQSKAKIRGGARRGGLAAARKRRRNRRVELAHEAQRTTEQDRLDEIAREICELEAADLGPVR